MTRFFFKASGSGGNNFPALAEGRPRPRDAGTIRAMVPARRLSLGGDGCSSCGGAEGGARH